MLNQPAIASVSTVPITKHQSIPEQDTDKGENNGAKVLEHEVLSEGYEEAKFDPEATVVPPAGQEEAEAVVESNILRLDNLVCQPSMFDREMVVNEPPFCLRCRPLVLICR